MLYPHEQAQNLSNEPHFQRVWQHYREHILRVRYSEFVRRGEISK